jgi:hypothetical protein
LLSVHLHIMVSLFDTLEADYPNQVEGPRLHN